MLPWSFAARSQSHNWSRPMHIDPTAQLHPFPIGGQQRTDFSCLAGQLF
ncbi:uncharacterized protein PpBr36_06446 [Pyricularia pennisetigena]|nr:uncharacterized protein PpBr36_06446 [Pyricularia pennisetigena]TLS22833.1 hypothetical protein PpBr36_06446 [Pyricularia pennisetigena]